ncbi:uncharacterized protein CTHT_0035940 [Thermochaetoides thermophila DSM 1495]|uniref:DUF7053 domain-containing protein n=1 Tax=Chaetomium thermophilum (strain DSM 1495 / CBS 144.50 / IMI 039719) TaxID=759272 RepID=G0S729_CHATD|nr:hypothetical protein CTHT_0035940 [Thermochaetoides thermophila DSM 1495]EGS21727.1 hypothetical protein CTHT_0035940 [Thermochaetoides thermophila DSM 1495]
MLRKKENFTIITPIPGFIPRQLAIDILHSHSEVITLNPLVIDHKPIPAPSNAETDEYYSTWYEITERIQFVPGLGKIGSSTIKFNGCFHDMPWGLQTHIYAPMHVDLRNTYRICGNQPGVEPPEVPEIGLRALGAPADGLYLREDIEIRCNVTVMSFVKSQLKKAGGEMVKRIIKKAELLDAGVLQAMIEDGKLRTINPADRTHLPNSRWKCPGDFYYTSPPLRPSENCKNSWESPLDPRSPNTNSISSQTDAQRPHQSETQESKYSVKESAEPENKKGYLNSLAPHGETDEEHQSSQKNSDASVPRQAHFVPYNPADYAKFAQQHQHQQAASPYGHGQSRQQYGYVQ